MADKPTIKNYLDASIYLLGGRDPHKRVRPLSGASTMLRRGPDTVLLPHIDVVYHDCPVVRYYVDGRIFINTDGWFNPTTMQRINAYTPDHVRVWLGKGHKTGLNRFGFRIEYAGMYVQVGEMTSYFDHDTGPILVRGVHSDLLIVQPNYG